MLTGTDQWDLVTAFLKLRRAVFIEKMEWPLYQAEDMEFEQYDRVDTVYVIAHIGNRGAHGCCGRTTSGVPARCDTPI
mgnify:CR=1 FL=1